MTSNELEDFTADKLGLCGCGEIEEELQLLKEVLLACRIEYPDNERQEDAIKKLLGTECKGVYYSYMAWLDHAGLIEHGTAIRWSWRTELGNEVLVAIDNFF